VVAQDSAKPLAELNPKLRSEFMESKEYTSKITVLERDGTRVRGIVTSINSDSVSITVQYGTPVIEIPFDQIDKVDHPPLTHRSKVWLGILVVVSIVGIVVLAIYAAKGASNDSHLP